MSVRASIASIAGMAALVLLAACGQDAARQAPGAPAEATVLLDDFEPDHGWTLDSANDYAALSVVEGHTSGTTALQVDFADNGRDKAVLRDEVALDCSGTQRLLIDALNPGTQEIQLALALRADDGSLWETKPATLAPGWNRNLAFALDADGFKTAFDAAKWKAASATINRLLIYVIPAKGDGRVVLQHLRAAPAAQAMLRRDQARIVALSTDTGPRLRYATLELGLDAAFPPASAFAKEAVADPFMRRMTAVAARVAAPDGSVFTARGFCRGIDLKDGEAVYHYLVRLAPETAGEWRYQLGVEAGGRWTWAPTASFVVSGEAAGQGPIRLDPGDPRWLARADGSFFWPIGENVAWSGDYEPYAAALGDAGANSFRTWICPWNNALDVGGRLDEVNFASADRLDAMFAVAAKHGLAVQLCLQYHGMLGGDWGRNPFNKANGGPCTDAREFWSNGTARALFKRYLDYVVARWSASSSLLAWELINEADLTPRFRDDDVISWHREMAEYLKSIDPSRHLVTSSTAWFGGLTDLWKQPALDLIEVHAYDPSAPRALENLAPLLAGGRPMLIGEYGRGWMAADDQPDRQGRSLRQAIWAAWMRGFAGAPWPWWWDTHIEPNQLTKRLAPLVAFLKDEDPRGRDLRAVQQELPGGAQVLCLIGTDRAYGCVLSNSHAELPTAADLVPAVPARSRIGIAGLAPGAWVCEIVDLEQGGVVGGGDLTVGNDGAELMAPTVSGEFAFKLWRRRPLVRTVGVVGPDAPAPSR
jgi:hypothetical protein